MRSLGTVDAPLKGRRLLFLRQSPTVLRAIRDCQNLGAEILIAPIITVTDPDAAQSQALDTAIGVLSDRYDWVILTSQEGVERFVARCEARRRTLDGERPAFVAVGSITAAQLKRHGIIAKLTPHGDFSQSGLIEAVGKLPRIQGQRFLLPVADQARSSLEQYLRSQGALVDRMTLYRTVFLPLERTIQEKLASGAIDGIFYTSSASATALSDGLSPELCPQFQRTPAFSIGAQTSKTLASLGVTSIIEAPTASVAALVEAAIDFFRVSGS